MCACVGACVRACANRLICSVKLGNGILADCLERLHRLGIAIIDNGLMSFIQKADLKYTLQQLEVCEIGRAHV